MQEFPMLGWEPQMEEFLNKRILLDGGVYKVVTCLGGDAHNYTVDPKSEELIAGWKTSLANGVYDFVIMPNHLGTVFVRKANWYKRDVQGRPNNIDRGHSSIAKQGKVVFAGELFFGGRTDVKNGKNPGELTAWTNKSGHYKIGLNLNEGRARELCKAQTEHARNLLPMNLLDLWDGDV